MIEPITVLKKKRRSIVAERKIIAERLNELESQVRILQTELDKIDAKNGVYDAAILKLSSTESA